MAFFLTGTFSCDGAWAADELLSYSEGVMPADLVSTPLLLLLRLWFVVLLSRDGGVNIGPANPCDCLVSELILF